MTEQPAPEQGIQAELPTSAPSSTATQEQTPSPDTIPLPPMPPWTVHDLRRTARSLLSRIGVNRDIAERVLGHQQQGVLAIYDRHKYEPEMADALSRLAGEIERILHPGAQVVALHG